MSKDFTVRRYPGRNLLFCPKLGKLIARRFFITWYLTKMAIAERANIFVKITRNDTVIQC